MAKCVYLETTIFSFYHDERSTPADPLGDALHLALASLHKADYLLTWNCKHLANAELLGAISSVLTRRGYVPPVICTPEELMESGDEDH